MEARLEQLVTGGLFDNSLLSVIEEAQHRRDRQQGVFSSEFCHPELCPDSWEDGKPIWHSDCWESVVRARLDHKSLRSLMDVHRSVWPLLYNGLTGIGVQLGVPTCHPAEYYLLNFPIHELEMWIHDAAVRYVFSKYSVRDVPELLDYNPLLW